MNKTLRRILTFALLALPTLSAWGQTNLINNPSFEEWISGRPKHWNIDRYLSGEQVTERSNVRTGTSALSVWQTGATFSPGLHHETEGFMDITGIQPNVKYTLSFWVKGDKDSYSRTLRPVTFTWKGGGRTTVSDIPFKDYYGVQVTTEWKEVKISVVSPEHAQSLALSINVPSGGSDAPRLFLDDFSLTAEAPKLQAPSVPTATTHQRELELSWIAIEGASYELLVNNKTYNTTNNSLLVSGLVPATDYVVKLRLSKGGTTSDWTTTTLRTSALTTSVDEEGRTPFLRTIREGGNCPTLLGLFYNELHSDTASFVYTLDGVIVQPSEQGMLTLPKGEHVLQVEVRESDARVYYLTYNLIVN